MGGILKVARMSRWKGTAVRLIGAALVLMAGALPAGAQPPLPGDPTVPLGGLEWAAIGTLVVTVVVLNKKLKS